MKIFETGAAKFIKEAETSLDSHIESSSFNFEKSGDILPDNIEGMETTGFNNEAVNEFQQQIEFQSYGFRDSLGLLCCEKKNDIFRSKC